VRGVRGGRTALVLMVLGVLGAAQRRSPGDGAIVGQVVDGMTGNVSKTQDIVIRDLP
jgi:hypothetical protein